MRCFLDLDFKNSRWFALLFDQAKNKNKQNFIKKIFSGYDYFGGYDVTNVSFVRFTRLTKIVLNFRTHVLQVLKSKQFCVNLRKSDKISRCILGFIGDKKCLSDKE